MGNCELTTNYSSQAQATETESLPRLKAWPSWSTLSSPLGDGGKDFKSLKKLTTFPFSAVFTTELVFVQRQGSGRGCTFSLLVLGKWRRHQPCGPTASHLDTLTSSPHSVSPANSSTWGRTAGQELRVPAELCCLHAQHSSGTPDVGCFDIHLEFTKLATSALKLKGKNRKSLDGLHRFASLQHSKCI